MGKKVRFLRCTVPLIAVAVSLVGCGVVSQSNHIAQATQTGQVRVPVQKAVNTPFVACNTKKASCNPQKPVSQATRLDVTPTPTVSSQQGHGTNTTNNRGSSAPVVPAAPLPSTPTPVTTTVTQAAQAVFAQINQQRAGAGLPALTWSTQLVQSAHAHNLTMVAAHQLSHQLPGEASLGTRITQTGLVWSSAAENIGTGTGEAALAMSLGLNQSMFGEKPPNDGHRLNILSKNTLIGVDVIVDSKGQVWLTEDFARPL